MVAPLAFSSRSKVEEPLLDEGVKPARGLVKDDEPRLVGQTLDDTHLLPCCRRTGRRSFSSDQVEDLRESSWIRVSAALASPA